MSDESNPSELPVQPSHQVPIEFYRNTDGRAVIVGGARKVAALKALAAAGAPGFTDDMTILATDVTVPMDNN
jgi:hypothetical protein